MTPAGTAAAAAIFEAWFLRLAPALLVDDLGVATTASYEGRFSYVTRFVLNTLGAQSPVASGALGALVRRHTDAGA